MFSQLSAVGKQREESMHIFSIDRKKIEQDQNKLFTRKKIAYNMLNE